MSIHVVEDYPTERLPEDLRRRVGEAARVRITIDVPAEPSDPPPFKPKRLRDFIGAAPGVYESPEEATAYIRALRDEWD